MDLKPALQKLEKSPDFKKWHQKNKNTYFSYAFKILEEMGSDDWQLGFYDKKKDRITTFMMVGGNINIRPEEEVFKKEDTKVNEVQLDSVRLAFDSIIAKSNEFQNKNFPNDKSVKTIVILQNIPKYGNVWNITFVTEAFNTLNMKIDASSGKILEHNLSSILSFRQK